MSSLQLAARVPLRQQCVDRLFEVRDGVRMFQDCHWFDNVLELLGLWFLWEHRAIFLPYWQWLAIGVIFVIYAKILWPWGEKP